MSSSENITLPFFEVEDSTKGNSCRGLFYDNFFGKGVICNIITKEFKLLTPPNINTSKSLFGDCGLGYDLISDNYKVIRSYYPYGGRFKHVDISILLKLKTEIYSLKNDAWKEILGSDIHSDPDCGVFLEGESSCYWPVLVDDSDVDSLILSFNFTSESFFRLPLPLAPKGKSLTHELFDYGGSLVVVAFERHQHDYGSAVGKYFDLWVDGRFMFLDGNSDFEGSSCGRHSHLMIYDWVKEELKEYKIFDIPHTMRLLSYTENRFVLPDGEPMNVGQSANDSWERGFKKRRIRRWVKYLHKSSQNRTNFRISLDANISKRIEERDISETSDICGPLVLLQIWAWERLPFVRPGRAATT
ncbi:hypothetical protein OROGR_018339 [Orobanche gracilis]